MITQVSGTVDGQAVVFTHNARTGDWDALIPRDLDGTYIVDLWAYNDAGSIGYYATVLFTVDPGTLQFVLTVIKYRLKSWPKGCQLVTLTARQRLERRINDYMLVPQPCGYYLEKGEI